MRRLVESAGEPAKEDEIKLERREVEGNTVSSQILARQTRDIRDRTARGDGCRQSEVRGKGTSELTCLAPSCDCSTSSSAWMHFIRSVEYWSGSWTTGTPCRYG